MAEPVNLAARRVTMQLGFALAMLPAAAFCGAENLPDPTRPPPSIALGDGLAAAVPPAPALQSVLIAPGRTMAIISGRPVKLGDKYGDARVEAIREGEVVLRSGKRVQTLTLFPGIEKRLTSNRAGAKPDRSTQ